MRRIMRRLLTTGAPSGRLASTTEKKRIVSSSLKAIFVTKAPSATLSLREH